jgi:predicted NUDIX family phosphoesterase
MEEQVLVVRADLIEPLVTKPYSRENAAAVLDCILQNHFFLERSKAEYDPTFRQAIPYVVARCGERFLLLKRTKKQTEARLHDKYSLGIGGHINPEPLNGAAHIVERGLRRELAEEIHFSGKTSYKLEGVICDDSNEVSRVHLGLVFLLETDSEQFSVNEKDLMTARWATRDEIAGVYPYLETWSQVVFENCLKAEVGGRV